MSVFNAYMALSGAVDAEVLRGERLSRRTTLRVGGPASLFVTAHDYAALRRTIEVLDRERVEWVVLGRGSNVLASDEGFDGCVVKLGREFSRVSVGEGGLVSAGAGAPLSSLVSQTLKEGLSGLECCVGIPGSVGGAVSMDAGSRHEWIGSRVSDVVTLRPGVGLRRYEGSEVEWGYRWCSLPAGEVILEASLRLDPSTREEVSAEMERRLASRRSTQPMGQPSCGSVFKNPGTRSAGALIDSCGLKGYAVGGARVSDLHANFIVNTGGATATDVARVMAHLRECVVQRHGIELEPEVKCLGFGR
ncbi:UDP-N-acetylenolpyruvoylglucosamine reductase [Olsenella sp. oral taxon 809 str. F0356]|uniref:UDP-N-acetylmuramate dehydrogenase n=2 Tax=Olsenella TaxID=133925 RepID=UPI000231F36A|nr:UDP-N-acetylmuramate dehydrogenase [Olsenella sp. oral taxon 809]EHF01426.1 UDP-N-acetylenolpyruvoylglucosamine reductase [Olsenella sp. oral taxon 809 str. F0356]